MAVLLLRPAVAALPLRPDLVILISAMNASREIAISKALSRVLRHEPHEHSLHIQSDGFCLLWRGLRGKPLWNLGCSENDLRYVVTHNDKSRFEIQGDMIRASQGHSCRGIRKDELMAQVTTGTLPEACIHFTYRRLLESIMANALLAGGPNRARNDVHCIPYPIGDRRIVSGGRADAEIAIALDIGRLVADGCDVFMSKNDVLITEGFAGCIPPIYLLWVRDLATGFVYECFTLSTGERCVAMTGSSMPSSSSQSQPSQPRISPPVPASEVEPAPSQDPEVLPSEVESVPSHDPEVVAEALARLAEKHRQQMDTCMTQNDGNGRKALKEQHKRERYKTEKEGAIPAIAAARDDFDLASFMPTNRKFTAAHQERKKERKHARRHAEYATPTVDQSAAASATVPGSSSSAPVPQGQQSQATQQQQQGTAECPPPRRWNRLATAGATAPLLLMCSVMAMIPCAETTAMTKMISGTNMDDQEKNDINMVHDAQGGSSAVAIKNMSYQNGSSDAPGGSCTVALECLPGQCRTAAMDGIRGGSSAVALEKECIFPCVNTKSPNGFFHAVQNGICTSALECSPRQSLAFVGPQSGSSKYLRLGCDFGGLEVPAMSAAILGLPIHHMFSSESNEHLRTEVLKYFSPALYFKDALSVPVCDMPKVDIYVGGPPCPPFSTAGRRRGVDDPRGPLIYRCVDYILFHRPILGIIENVSGLVASRNKDVLDDVVGRLRSGGFYDVRIHYIDSRDNGLPQRRPRIYIVCRLVSHIFSNYHLLKHIPTPALDDFLEDGFPDDSEAFRVPDGLQGTCRKIVLAELDRLITSGLWPLSAERAIDIDTSFAWRGHSSHLCPCLLHGHPKGPWLLARGRRMTLHEMAHMQGIHAASLRWPAKSRTLAQALGNTMSVNVVCRLLLAVLPSLRLHADLLDVLRHPPAYLGGICTHMQRTSPPMPIPQAPSSQEAALRSRLLQRSELNINDARVLLEDGFPDEASSQILEAADNLEKAALLADCSSTRHLYRDLRADTISLLSCCDKHKSCDLDLTTSSNDGGSSAVAVSPLSPCPANSGGSVTVAVSPLSSGADLCDVSKDCTPLDQASTFVDPTTLHTFGSDAVAVPPSPTSPPIIDSTGPGFAQSPPVRDVCVGGSCAVAGSQASSPTGPQLNTTSLSCDSGTAMVRATDQSTQSSLTAAEASSLLIDELISCLRHGSRRLAAYYQACAQHHFGDKATRGSLFPLPVLVPRGGSQVDKLVPMIVAGLNFLNSDGVPGTDTPSGTRKVSAAQRRALDIIREKTSVFVKNCLAYEQEEPGAPNAAQALAALRTQTRGLARPLVSDRVDLAVRASTCDPLIYMDPAHARALADPAVLFLHEIPTDVSEHKRFTGSRREYVNLTARMAISGKVRFRHKAWASAQVFAVGKKSSGQLREVWCGDRISAVAAKPPLPPRLGNPGVFSRCHYRSGTHPVFSKRDAKTYFDLLALPPSLRPFFGRPVIQAEALAKAMGLCVVDLVPLIDDAGSTELNDST